MLERESYTLAGLAESDLDPDPFEQFRAWMAQAVAAGLREPNAMTLATASPDGVPAARIVLLKDFSHEGFVFFTNYESRKGQELAANPRACLVFYWGELERQVRIDGIVSQVSREESGVYFHTRPEGSQIGAWASRQSSVVPGREELEQAAERLARGFAGKPVPLPPFWGGYRVYPSSFEFWQGRVARMHDRLRYRAVGNSWVIERLAP